MTNALALLPFLVINERDDVKLVFNFCAVTFMRFDA